MTKEELENLVGSPYTVGELISLLQNYDPNDKVFMSIERYAYPVNLVIADELAHDSQLTGIKVVALGNDKFSDFGTESEDQN